MDDKLRDDQREEMKEEEMKEEEMKEEEMSQSPDTTTMYCMLFHEGINEASEDEGIQIHDLAGQELTMFYAKRESKLSKHKGDTFKGQFLEAIHSLKQAE